MVDRILHIGHRFSNVYDKELLQRAAQVYIYKNPAAVVPHLITVEKLDTAAAETLAQDINREMIKVNRSVVLQYAVILLIFLFIVGFSLATQSYIFGGIFLVPALFILYSMVKFIR